MFLNTLLQEILFWSGITMVLEKTLESLLDCREIQPVHPKGDQSWVFIGRTDAEAETPILWPPHANSWLVGKDPDAGRDWGQEEKGTTEDEMAEWHHRLDGHEFEWTLGVGDGQGGLACCDSWGCKESDMTERLNWTDSLCSFKSRLHQGIAFLFACILSRFIHVWPFGLQPASLLCPWDSPGKNTIVDCHALLQGIFLSQGSNSRLSCLLHYQVGS